MDALSRDGDTIAMPGEGLWKLRFNSDSRLYSDDFGDFDSFDVTAYAGEHDGMPAHAAMTSRRTAC